MRPEFGSLSSLSYLFSLMNLSDVFPNYSYLKNQIKLAMVENFEIF
jgi:hypothetical protein